MRFFISLIILLGYRSVHAQALSQELFDTIFASNLPTDTSESGKKKAMLHWPEIKKQLDCYMESPGRYSKGPWEFLHFIDLDRDGLEDVIYVGSCAPYNSTWIFWGEGSGSFSLKNLNDSLRLYFYDTLNSIEQDSSGTQLVLTHHSCCADYTYVISKFVVPKGQKQIVKLASLKFSNRIYSHWEKVGLNKEMKLKSAIISPDSVRSMPSHENYWMEDPASDDMMHYNFEFYIPRRTSGYVLKEHPEKPWVLCMIGETEIGIGWLPKSKITIQH
ncbi:MAG: VCBS repeat-containing protein [Bacteroidia bacterium]|nr:VCBS repeat-containing protein [Bacteroidia bacterium]